MDIISVRLRLQPESSIGKCLPEFYEFVAMQLGDYPITSGIKYDCTKIRIAGNLQELLFDAYRQHFPERYQEDPDEFNTQVNMLMACSGPRVNEDLPDDAVEVFPAYVCDAEGNPLLWKGGLADAVRLD